MALPDFTGQNIENTYQRVLQTDGGDLRDGTGSLVTLTNITASGNISSSGTIVGSNLSGTNTGDQDISKFVENAHTAMPLFQFKTSTNTSLLPSAGEFLEIDGVFDLIGFNTQSLDGVNLAPNSISTLIYDSPGSVFTVIETGSGAYKTYKTNTVFAQTGEHIKFTTFLTQKNSSGSISNNDIVFLRFDQSAPLVEFQPPSTADALFAPLLDSTFNFIDVRFTSNIASDGILSSVDTTTTEIHLLPAISKSADLTLGGLTVNSNTNLAITGSDVTFGHITASGNISSSGTITAASFVGTMDGGSF